MGICDLVKLQRLNLSFNFIESLPQDLSRLTDLEEVPIAPDDVLSLHLTIHI